MHSRKVRLPVLACCLCGLLLTLSFPVNAQERKNLPARQSVVPPPLPVIKAPIEFFRALLTMDDAERERALAERSPEQKKVLQAKLKEYSAMSVEDRETRLVVTELRWYLLPLMKSALPERLQFLRAIPEEKRSLIEDRLRQWDALSATQQKEFLENEMTIHYFLRVQPTLPPMPPGIAGIPSANNRKNDESEKWRSMSTEQRDRMFKRFQQFFEMNADEKQKTLQALSNSERLEMEKSLQKFQQLAPAQRRHCIESFSKLSTMNAMERKQFLRKAEVWQNMSAADRKAWRELVAKLPQMPPLPPGLKIVSTPPVPLVATNFPR
ncbi:MAG: DUF3106 domain-containing protein [Verrucomicrobiota bacterium]